MRFLNYLQEDHIDSIMIYPGQFPIDIYKNPDSRDLRELTKYRRTDLRFIADPHKQNLFVFDGYGATHVDTVQFLHRKGHIEDKNVIFGYALIKTGKLSGYGSCYTHYPASKLDIDKEMKSWIYKYIKNDYRVVVDDNYRYIVFK
jgi:hypothetical protein